MGNNVGSCNKMVAHFFFSPVIVHDGVESMSNSDDSALTELTPDGFLNEVISFQVHSSCGFIQH